MQKEKGKKEEEERKVGFLMIIKFFIIQLGIQ